MEHWEFLIQKEGDRTWHPLKSPATEIQEGRYRVIVRSSRIDTEVDMRIAYESTNGDPPKRKSQNQTRRTNSEGLMVVIPFNYLKPGIWEFRCRPDFITDLMGDTWQHTIQLNVLPQPQNADGSGTNGGISTASRPAGMNGSTHRLSQSEIPDHQHSPTPQPKSAVASLGQFTKSDRQTLRLILDQEMYMARQGQSLTLAGRVESSENLPSKAPSSPTGELQICLRDPQNSQILLEVRQQLPAQVPPFPFACQIDLPPDCKTRLILGDIVLYGVPSTANAIAPILATQSFTITTGVEELLSSFASGVPRGFTDDLGEVELMDLQSAAKAASLDLSIFDKTDTPKEVPLIHFERSEGIPLPPLLYKSDRDSLKNTTPKPLELPKLPNRYPIRTTAKPKSAAADSTKIDGDEVANSLQDNQEVSASVAETETAAELQNHSDAAEIPANPQSETHPSGEEKTGETALEDANFRALKVQDRFWSRLNALATDDELSAWLEATNANFPQPDSAAQSLLFGNISSYNPAGPDAELAALEFVVDDEPVDFEPPKAAQNRLSADNSPLSEDEPVPTPELNVPKGELVAGQSIYIRVRLPHQVPQFGVRLWLQDRQTRSLLEEPYWIVNFSPNGWGQLEAVAQITVPFGCVEIRFEAIAIELQTRRESYKVTVDRTVIPPHLPTFAANEFEV